MSCKVYHHFDKYNIEAAGWASTNGAAQTEACAVARRLVPIAIGTEVRSPDGDRDGALFFWLSFLSLSRRRSGCKQKKSDTLKYKERLPLG